MNCSAQMCRPFRPRFCLSSVTTRLRAWLPSDSSQSSWFCKLLQKQVTTAVFGGGGLLFTAGASRLVSLPTRSKHKAANDLQTSLEEAAVNRPGREAGIRNDEGFERRRRGTGIRRTGLSSAIISQLLGRGPVLTALCRPNPGSSIWRSNRGGNRDPGPATGQHGASRERR